MLLSCNRRYFLCGETAIFNKRQVKVDCSKYIYCADEFENNKQVFYLRDTVILPNTFILTKNICFRLVHNAFFLDGSKEYVFLSEKIHLNNKKYVSQIISRSGYSSCFIIGDEITNRVEMYIVSINAYGNKISLEDFLFKLRPFCEEKTFLLLKDDVTNCVKKNFNRFPVFKD